MTDYNFDQNSRDFSDEYRSDKRKSDKYSEAARQANLNNQNSVKSGDNYRNVNFEHSSYDGQDEEILARERAFRDTLEDIGYRDNNYSDEQESLDLDELDELEQTAPYQAAQRAGRTNRSEVLRPKRTTSSAKSKNTRPSMPNPLRDIFGGLQQALFLALSKRPMQAFHLNLHWGSLGILALINILLVAGFNTIIYSKVMQDILESIGSLVEGVESSATGRLFGISLLSQFVTLIITTLMIFVLTVILRSERKNFKQFVQTATLSTLPYSLILFVSLIVSLFLPQVGIILALTGKVHAYIYLYAGFQKGHPTKRNSPFWFFIILIALVLVVQYFFITWAL